MLVLRTERLALRWLTETDANDYWRDGHGLWRIEQRGADVGTCGLVADGAEVVLVCEAPPDQAAEAAAACARYALDALGLKAAGERRFAWDEARSIDDLIGRFFRGFTNRDAVPLCAALPAMFLPGASITIRRPEGVETLGLRQFVEPRAALLFGGRLTGFEEHEVQGDTRITGNLAFRACRYQKAGILDGAPYQGAGYKQFQLVRTARGWRIAALAWEDD